MIDQWIQSVCSQAGWEQPVKNNENKYRFRIEPDLVIDASSPDDRILVLESQVSFFADRHRDELVRQAATAVLPRVFKDSATLSLDAAGNGLVLHCTVTLGALRATEFPGVMENFINDLVFYKSL